jgi:hypothetical protein
LFALIFGPGLRNLTTAFVSITGSTPKSVGTAVFRISLAPGKENLVRMISNKRATPETQLKRAAVQLLKIQKIITWPYPGGIMGTRGFPDRFGILPGGGFLAIEFKANGRKLTEHQEDLKQKIEAAGGKYIVCRCLEDLTEGLGLGGRLF